MEAAPRRYFHTTRTATITHVERRCPLLPRESIRQWTIRAIFPAILATIWLAAKGIPIRHDRDASPCYLTAEGELLVGPAAELRAAQARDADAEHARLLRDAVDADEDEDCEP